MAYYVVAINVWQAPPRGTPRSTCRAPAPPGGAPGNSLAAGSLRASTQTDIGRARMTHLQVECTHRRAKKREEIQLRLRACSQDPPAGRRVEGVRVGRAARDHEHGELRGGRVAIGAEAEVGPCGVDGSDGLHGGSAREVPQQRDGPAARAL